MAASITRNVTLLTDERAAMHGCVAMEYGDEQTAIQVPDLSAYFPRNLKLSASRPAPSPLH